MKEYISLDVHKHYTFAEKEASNTGDVQHQRIEHKRGAILSYLKDVESGTPVAVEATGNWYWIVEEISQAGCQPKLVHPYRAKVMMGCINKTDKLDVNAEASGALVGYNINFATIAKASMTATFSRPATK